MRNKGMEIYTTGAQFFKFSSSSRDRCIQPEGQFGAEQISESLLPYQLLSQTNDFPTIMDFNPVQQLFKSNQIFIQRCPIYRKLLRQESLEYLAEDRS